MADKIQLRGDTAANWTSVNPVLAERELGIETDTLFYKIGNGVDNWNTLTYNYLRSIDSGTVTVYEGQTTTPTPPADGFLKFYSKSIANRMLPRVLGPSGVSTPLQPSFFQNNISMVSTGTTTAMNVVGTAITSVGTLSHPATTEAYGYMTNFASAATAGITAGTGDNLVKWCRGSVEGANGFFFACRAAFPDASYNETGASTGARIFVGLTDQTMAATAAANNPAGNRVGFSRIHVNGSLTETNFWITTRNGTSESRVDTGMLFTPQNVYDFYLFCRPQGTEVFWRVDNVTAGTTQEGSVDTYLPLNNVFMRAGCQIGTVNAVSRNVRIQRIYCESDR